MKKYVFKTGEEVFIRGAEPYALDLLQAQGYSFNEVRTETEKIPKIPYNLNNKISYYYPDIYIPSKNLIIEVKSTWTYEIKEDRNLKKKEACINTGYNFEFWIFDNKKRLVIK